VKGELKGAGWTAEENSLFPLSSEKREWEWGEEFELKPRDEPIKKKERQRIGAKREREK